MSSGGNQPPERYVTKLESDYSKLTTKEKHLILNVFGNLQKYFVCTSQEAVSKTAKLCAIKYRLVAKIIEDFDLGLLDSTADVKFVPAERHANDTIVGEQGGKGSDSSVATSRGSNCIPCSEQRPAIEAAVLDTIATKPVTNGFFDPTSLQPFLPDVGFLQMTKSESSPDKALEDCDSILPIFPEDHEMPADSTTSTPVPLVVIPGNVAANGEPYAGVLMYNEPSVPVYPNMYYAVKDEPPEEVGSSSPVCQPTSRTFAEVLDVGKRKRFSCHRCMETFTSEQSYSQHFSQAHKPSTYDMTAMLRDRWFTCRYCSQNVLGNDVIRHVMFQHTMRSLACDFCSSTFATCNMLLKHIKDLHAYDFLCRYGMQGNLET